MSKTGAFDKYQKRGGVHWREMESLDPRRLNAYLAARYEWILRFAGDLKGKKVLDLGCGDGALTHLLAQAGAQVTGVDADETGLAYAAAELRERGAHAEFLRASVDALPFTESSFDTVVSCEVIEHLPEPEKMLREAARVLRRGGKLVLTTPYRLTEVPQDPHHAHEFYPAELTKLVEKDFIAVEYKLTHHLFWRSLYTYGVRGLGGRPLGKWLINTLTLLFKWNPFMIDYTNRAGKFDLFGTICVTAIKP